MAASLASRRSSVKDERRNATAELRSTLICQVWGKSIFYCWEAAEYKGVFCGLEVKGGWTAYALW
jgi:hypothetical protein